MNSRISCKGMPSCTRCGGSARISPNWAFEQINCKSGSNTANIFSYNFNNNRYVYQLKTTGYAPGPHCATVVFHTFDAGALPFTTCFNIVP